MAKRPILEKLVQLTERESQLGIAYDTESPANREAMIEDLRNTRAQIASLWPAKRAEDKSVTDKTRDRDDGTPTSWYRR